jgi:hypothetical protein
VWDGAACGADSAVHGECVGTWETGGPATCVGMRLAVAGAVVAVGLVEDGVVVVVSMECHFSVGCVVGGRAWSCVCVAVLSHGRVCLHVSGRVVSKIAA